MNVLRQDGCLDVRKLAGQLGVDTTDVRLMMIIGDLERNRKIRRIGGKGRHTLFVLATFEG